MPLICPACRVISDERVDLFALELVERTWLACQNRDCGQRYPIVHGIALVGLDLGSWLPSEALPLLAAPWPTELTATLAQAGDDAGPVQRWLEHLSLYVDAHYGDRTRPEARDTFGFAALAAKIAERAVAPVETAIELGCSVGRGLFELGRGARHVYGLDRNAASLRAAATLLSGQGLPFGRRVVGRHYAEAEAQPPGPPPATVQLVACDVLDPPLPPGLAERIVAFNLLDAVASPRQLLCVIDALLQPGGEALLASPYAWTSGYTDEHERLGGAAPEAALRAILRSGEGLQACYDVEDEAELDWTLRRDAHLSHRYRVDYLRVRKSARPGSRA